MKIKTILSIFLCAISIACTNQNTEKMKADKEDLDFIFPKGEKGSSDFFTGNAYNTGLVDADSVLQQQLVMSILNQVPEAIGIHILRVKY